MPRVDAALISEFRKPAPATRIWPHNDATPGTISESRSYVFELRGDALEDVELLVDGISLVPLRSVAGAARWLWEPGFYAGLIDLQARSGGRRIWAARISLDPALAKLTRDQFDEMVREILSDTLALFAMSSARKSIARGAGAPVPPIGRLEFLRSRVDAIVAVVTEITASPVRILRSRERIIKYTDATAVSARDLAVSFRREEIRPLPRVPLVIRFPYGLPARLHATRREVSLDIGEHRAIKSQLRTWSAWLKQTGRALKGNPVDPEDDPAITDIRKRWSADCATMARRLDALLELPMFKEVADSAERVTITPVFKWSAAYRKFFRLSTDFNLGLARVFGEFLDMPLARTFDLYELWAFLRLAKAATSLFQTPALNVAELFDATGRDVTIRTGFVSLQLAPGVILSFKKRFREYWLTTPPRIGSYSRPMIPDVSISQQPAAGRAQVVVLDAKYRVDEQLADAIATLHTYRDAIVSEADGGQTEQAVRAAYLVTPHVAGVEGLEQTPWRDQLVPALLFHPAYRSEFRFGAFTLRPGMADGEIRDALQLVLCDAGIKPPMESAAA